MRHCVHVLILGRIRHFVLLSASLICTCTPVLQQWEGFSIPVWALNGIELQDAVWGIALIGQCCLLKLIMLQCSPFRFWPL